LIVGVLSLYSGKKQVRLATDSGTYQPQVSLFLAAKKTPEEATLRRMAEAAGLDWSLVVHLRRIFEAVLSAADAGARVGGYDGELDRVLLDRALAALTPYILYMQTRAAREQPREQIESEAREIWDKLTRYPPQERRELIEHAPRASRNWALAILACEASVTEAPGDAHYARELAELAVAIAERVEGKPQWKSRLQGYCLAHLADAQWRANRPIEASETFTQAYGLWRSGADLEPPALEESRLRALAVVGGSRPDV
jgi:hypothetical protein